jgi:hypothetical protein
MAPTGLMYPKEGGTAAGSYSQATTGGRVGERSKRPTFEPPPDLYSKIWEEGVFKD